MRTKRLLFLLYFLPAFYCYSQSIKNVDFGISENKILMTFDMVDFPKEGNFDISIMLEDTVHNILIPNSSKILLQLSEGLERINKKLKHRYTSGLTIFAYKNKTETKHVRWDVIGDIKRIEGTFKLVVEVQTGFYTTGNLNREQNQIRVKGESGFKYIAVPKVKQVIKKPKTDTISYMNGLTFNSEAIGFADIKLTFSHRINKSLYFESMVSYNIPHFKNETSIVSPFLLADYPLDPYYYYGRIQLRAGIKYYPKRNFYIGMNLLTGYGKFKDGIVSTENNEYYDIVNRTKNEFEVFFKIGKTFQHKHLLYDYYMGLGYREKYIDDTVIGWAHYPEQLYYYSPGSSYGSSYLQSSLIKRVQLHFGFQLGYCK